MKILWLTNNIMPYPASKLKVTPSVFGGWLLSLVDAIIMYDDVELAIATIYDCKKIEQFDDGKIKYYLIPGKLNHKYYKKTEKYFKELDDIFCADIVHLQGSEFYHGLAYLNALPNKKIILSIQGLVSICGRDFLADISKVDIIKSITFRDIIKFDNLIQMQKKYLIRGSYEQQIIKKVEYVIGRTTWDYSCTLALNRKLKYNKIDESLRKKFYDSIWNINVIKPYTIFISQASQPLKGFHIFLDALLLVKKEFPNVKVYVGGQNIIKYNTIYDKIKLSNYGNYLRKKIKKNHLENNIKFLGLLSEQQMIEKLLEANVFVLPSKIENSSNSLCEAMLLGVPCVASFVGGTPDMLEHNLEGYLYPYDSSELLANYIIKIFKDRDLAKKISKNARARALKRHNLKNNVTKIYDLYVDVFNKRGV